MDGSELMVNTTSQPKDTVSSLCLLERMEKVKEFKNTIAYLTHNIFRYVRDEKMMQGAEGWNRHE